MNKLIVAAAGSGKTTHIVNEALKVKDKRVLITTFTEANAKEIEKKLYQIYGYIPSNIVIQTWFSFLLEHGVKPFQSSLTNKKINGILLVNQKSGFRFYAKGRPVYWGEDNLEKYYFTEDVNVYTDKLAKLVFRCNEKSENAVIERLANIFSYIFIDEVQDMAGYDLELIKLILETKVKTILVGDPRQVTYHTHEAAKYSKYKDGNIEGFIRKECRSVACEIDVTTLNKTHRNNPSICAFANKVYPNQQSCISGQDEITGHDGVFLVRESDIDKYLEKYQSTQLRYSSATKVNEKYQVLNFGGAKGITCDRVLIYPTKPMVEWLKSHDNELKNESRAKLYVAITRAKYSVAFITKKFDKLDISGVEKWGDVYDD